MKEFILGEWREHGKDRRADIKYYVNGYIIPDGRIVQCGDKVKLHGEQISFGNDAKINDELHSTNMSATLNSDRLYVGNDFQIQTELDAIDSVYIKGEQYLGGDTVIISGNYQMIRYGNNQRIQEGPNAWRY